MNLISELLSLDEAKKPKCTCDKDEATCKVHGKKIAEQHLAEDDEYNQDIEIHYSPKGNGAYGDMFILDGKPNVGKLAAALGVPDGWKEPVKIGNVFASFSSGDRLSFFVNADDYVPDDDEGGSDDEHDHEDQD